MLLQSGLVVNVKLHFFLFIVIIIITFFFGSKTAKCRGINTYMYFTLDMCSCVKYSMIFLFCLCRTK